MTVNPRPSVLASCLPGRIRLRHALLRRTAERARLEAALAGVDGMLSIDVNPATGSLLLHYDPTRCAPAAMEAQVVALSADALGTAAAEVATDTPPRQDTAPRRTRRSTAKRVNRLAKFGMLAGLPLSLAFAAFGSKRLHVVSGGAFVVLLLAHLLVHRRHLTQ